jgi:hypothetical protein
MSDVTTWICLNHEELRKEIRSTILGQGMASSSQYLRFNEEYLARIESPELLNNVIRILVETMKDVQDDAASRALYIFTSLTVDDKQQVVLELIRSKEGNISKLTNSSLPVPDLMRNLEYLCELNRAIGRLFLVEGKEFLVKQLKTGRKTTPIPPSNEFFVHELSEKSALQSLRVLDPELAKKF